MLLFLSKVFNFLSTFLQSFQTFEGGWYFGGQDEVERKGVLAGLQLDVRAVAKNPNPPVQVFLVPVSLNLFSSSLTS